jgi:hypothetical protein
MYRSVLHVYIHTGYSSCNSIQTIHVTDNRRQQTTTTRNTPTQRPARQGETGDSETSPLHVCECEWPSLSSLLSYTFTRTYSLTLLLTCIPYPLSHLASRSHSATTARICHEAISPVWAYVLLARLIEVRFVAQERRMGDCSPYCSSPQIHGGSAK